MQTFLPAIIYLGNSFCNVLSGVMSKVAVLKLQEFIIPVYSLMFLRGIISMIVLSPAAIKHRACFLTNVKGNLLISTLTALDVFLFNIGLKGTAINQAIMIMFLIPIWTNIFSGIVLHETGVTKRNVASLVICFAALFISNPELNPYYILKNASHYERHGFNFYPLLILVNTFCVTFGLLLQKKFREHRPIFFGLFSNNVILCLLGFVFMDQIAPYINIYTVLIAVILVILDIGEFGFAYKAYSMSNVANLQPVRFTRIIISAIFGYILLGEKTTKEQVVGMILIVGVNLFNSINLHIKAKKSKLNI